MTSSGTSSSKMKELRLPISRVKTIMKSSPYVESIGQDGLYLVTKATELFIHYLTEEAHTQSNKGNSMDYKHLAEVVQTNDALEFLQEIIPRKITVREFKEMMAAKNSSSSHSSSSSSTSDSDSDSISDTESAESQRNNKSNSSNEDEDTRDSHSRTSSEGSKSDTDEEKT